MSYILQYNGGIIPCYVERAATDFTAVMELVLSSTQCCVGHLILGWRPHEYCGWNY